jgi:hypothetical protein
MLTRAACLRLLMLQDFDGGEAGQFVTRTVVASSGAPTAPTWSVIPTDIFPNGVRDLENAVIQEKAWAIIASTSITLVFHLLKNEVLSARAVSQNATETLRDAVVGADGTYVANRSISVYAAEARSENA